MQHSANRTKQLASGAGKVYSDWISRWGENAELEYHSELGIRGNQKLAAGLDYNDGTVAVDQRSAAAVEATESE